MDGEERHAAGNLRSIRRVLGDEQIPPAGVACGTTFRVSLHQNSKHSLNFSRQRLISKPMTLARIIAPTK